MRARFLFQGLSMPSIAQVVQRQAIGGRFVISATLLGMSVEAFDSFVQPWLTEPGPGFALAGVPHRKCIDGAFYIDRITVCRTS